MHLIQLLVASGELLERVMNFSSTGGQAAVVAAMREARNHRQT